MREGEPEGCYDESGRYRDAEDLTAARPPGPGGRWLPWPDQDSAIRVVRRGHGGLVFG